ncbi:MAG: hypothetical protein APF76_17525 [Desulfitibacter sp. BRH_c19]|nr:MAG: hypothetical protein APF76_17525 [Desulfitibacter sp. BRH_c19]
MLLLENAIDILFNELESSLLLPGNVETVPLWEAGGRVLAREVVATEDVPAFDRSPIDGFALIASDTLEATIDHPVSMKIIDTVAAGSYSKKILVPGTTMKIFTGAPLPQGANCLVKKEEVTETASEAEGSKSENDSTVIIKRKIFSGECIAPKGEDISNGEPLFASGTVLTCAHMGVLATLGIDPVPVYKKPQIGIFSTGNELVDVHSQLQHGQLRASNIYTLAEIIRQAGGVPVSLGIVKDRIEDVIQVYEKAYRLRLPIVISTGGTASGAYDVIKEAMDMISVSRLFNKVAIRPGAPVVASVKDGQLLIGLSGNPAGSAVAMLLVMFPVISKLAGTNRHLEQSQAKLSTDVHRKGGLRGFLWGTYYEQHGCLYTTPFNNQFCGAIKTHAYSNCLIEIAAGKVNSATGDLVNIWKLP